MQSSSLKQGRQDELRISLSSLENMIFFFFLFLVCFSSKGNIFRYACSKAEDVCVSGGALRARREADGLTWRSEGSSSLRLGRVCRKMADISRSRMHHGHPPLRKHNSPFLRLQQPDLDQMYRDSFLPA